GQCEADDPASEDVSARPTGSAHDHHLSGIRQYLEEEAERHLRIHATVALEPRQLFAENGFVQVRLFELTEFLGIDPPVADGDALHDGRWRRGWGCARFCARRRIGVRRHLRRSCCGWWRSLFQSRAFRGNGFLTLGEGNAVLVWLIAASRNAADEFLFFEGLEGCNDGPLLNSGRVCNRRYGRREGLALVTTAQIDEHLQCPRRQVFQGVQH